MLAKARGSNTINLYTRHFFKCQQWINQFPNTKVIPADYTHVIACILKRFLEKYVAGNFRISVFTIHYFQKVTGYKNAMTRGPPS